MSKALVKGVLSGDTIIISGPLSKDYSLPEEFNLTLTGVFAPKIGNSSKLEEEPYSFESREFLRKLIIGKVIIYLIFFCFLLFFINSSFILNTFFFRCF